MNKPYFIIFFIITLASWLFVFLSQDNRLIRESSVDYCLEHGYDSVVIPIDTDQPLQSYCHDSSGLLDDIKI